MYWIFTLACNSFERVLVTLPTIKFCTGVSCKIPPIKSTNNRGGRKNLIFWFLSLKKYNQMANQPARRTPKIHSGAASKTVVNKIPNVTQKISVKDIRFNMWKLLCSVLYYYAKITFRYLYTNSIPNQLSKYWYVKIKKYDF